MKKEYKEASYGKKELTIVAIVALVISVLMAVGGTVLIVKGCLVSGGWAKGWRIGLGVIIGLLGLMILITSITMLFTSFAMLNNKNGNVKDGNRAKGTINAKLCANCGKEIPETAQFCPYCKESTSEYKVCECGTRNPKDAKHCSTCGKEFDK